jgi:hypothetical protein
VSTEVSAGIAAATRILLLSTADTDLLAARASGARFRPANPSRLEADDVPRLLAGVEEHRAFRDAERRLRKQRLKP